MKLSFSFFCIFSVLPSTVDLHPLQCIPGETNHSGNSICLGKLYRTRELWYCPELQQSLCVENSSKDVKTLGKSLSYFNGAPAFPS